MIGMLHLLGQTQGDSLIGETSGMEIAMLIAGGVLTLIAVGIFAVIFLKMKKE